LTLPSRSHDVLAIGGIWRNNRGRVKGKDRRVSSMLCYNTLTNEWSKDQKSPLAFTDTIIATDPTTHYVYCFGGLNQKGGMDDIQCYDPAMRIWYLLPVKLNNKRHGGVAIYIPRFRGFMVCGGESAVTGHTMGHSVSIEFYSPMNHTCTLISVHRFALPKNRYNNFERLQSLHLIEGDPTPTTSTSNVTNGNISASGVTSVNKNGHGNIHMILVAINHQSTKATQLYLLR
jgi:hypothetical protein